MTQEEELTLEAPQCRISQLSRQGYAFMKQDLHAEALICFRQILDVEPDNNYALVGIGDVYRKKRRFKEAAQYYQRCLDAHTDNNYALFGLADCYRSLKQFHRAIEVWERYLTLDDRNVTVLTRVADAYRKVHNLERSAAIYHEVLEIEPSNAYALIGLGHLYYDFRDYPKAMQYWLTMAAQQGDQVDIRVLTSLGNCHRKLKTYAQGIPYFEQARQQDPGNFYALFGLADCYRGLNEQEKSLRYWTTILNHDPDNRVILTRAGDAHRKLGQLQAARSCYEHALAREYDAYAIIGLACIKRLEGQSKEAINSLETLIHTTPDLVRPYPDLLECYLEVGMVQQARSLCDCFNRHCSNSPQVREQLFRTLEASLQS